MAAFLPLIIGTVFWVAIGFGGPFLAPKVVNRGVIQTMIILTAVCCWLFWVLIYLHQINPLIGPQLPVRTIRWISEKWGNAPQLINN